MKKHKILQLLGVALPLAAALLSALPNVVKMNWMGGETTYCSAYSLLPVGYAVWGPFLAAMGTIVLAVLGGVSFLLDFSRFQKPMFVIAFLAALCSLSAVVFGNLTATGCVIALLLALEAAVVRRIRP